MLTHVTHTAPAYIFPPSLILGSAIFFINFNLKLPKQIGIYFITYF